MVAKGLADTWNVTWRELKHFSRSRAAMFSTLIQPFIWLAFMGNAFNFSNVGTQFMQQIVQILPQSLLLQLQPYMASLASINLTSIAFNGAPSFLNYFTPGVIAMTTLFGGIFGGFSIVWDRRLGFLNKMLAAPISRTSIGTGKILSASIRTGLQTAIIGMIAVFLLGVTVATGVLGFIVAILIAMLLCLAFAGLSMAIGASVKNVEAMMPVMNLLTMPLLFMSTAMFSTTMMPDWMVTATRFYPVTYAVDPIRALFNNDWTTFFGLLPDLLVVGVFALALMTLATILFRRSVA
jgi:ABC-2 type transport system permease protein